MQQLFPNNGAASGSSTPKKVVITNSSMESAPATPSSLQQTPSALQEKRKRSRYHSYDLNATPQELTEMAVAIIRNVESSFVKNAVNQTTGEDEEANQMQQLTNSVKFKKKRNAYRVCPICKKTIGAFGTNYKAHVRKCCPMVYNEVIRQNPMYFGTYEYMKKHNFFKDFVANPNAPPMELFLSAMQQEEDAADAALANAAALATGFPAILPGDAAATPAEGKDQESDSDNENAGPSSTAAATAATPNISAAAAAAAAAMAALPAFSGFMGPSPQPVRNARHYFGPVLFGGAGHTNPRHNFSSVPIHKYQSRASASASMMPSPFFGGPSASSWNAATFLGNLLNEMPTAKIPIVTPASVAAMQQQPQIFSQHTTSTTASDSVLHDVESVMNLAWQRVKYDKCLQRYLNNAECFNDIFNKEIPEEEHDSLLVSQEEYLKEQGLLMAKHYADKCKENWDEITRNMEQRLQRWELQNKLFNEYFEKVDSKAPANEIENCKKRYREAMEEEAKHVKEHDEATVAKRQRLVEQKSSEAALPPRGDHITFHQL